MLKLTIGNVFSSALECSAKWTGRTKLGGSTGCTAGCTSGCTAGSRDAKRPVLNSSIVADWRIGSASSRKPRTFTNRSRAETLPVLISWSVGNLSIRLLNLLPLLVALKNQIWKDTKKRLRHYILVSLMSRISIIFPKISGRHPNGKICSTCFRSSTFKRNAVLSPSFARRVVILLSRCPTFLLQKKPREKAIFCPIETD